MQDNTFLRAVYTVFLGIVTVLFVGLGVATFYEEPKAPEYPASTMYEEKMLSEPTPETIARQKEFDAQSKIYDQTRRTYSQNASIILLVSAVVLTMVAVLIEQRVRVIPDGVMIGGLLTLIYSLIKGADSGNSRYMFVAASVSLAVVLYLGYHRYIRSSRVTSARKS